MPPKKQLPPPIDRPLSKAYLRKFTGWSTAYPPGMSDPTSLRLMENLLVNREGSVRLRPGLRSLLPTKSEFPLVGSHELFYTETGKAYLVAVREPEAVMFRVISQLEDGTRVMQTLEEAGFDLPGDAGSVTFSSSTTYVKYLQIDNKVFALSNASEPMLMFWVGAEKKAKRLQSIDRPSWSTTDKLTVAHPDAAWVLGKDPVSTRYNLAVNPDFEVSTDKWSAANSRTQIWRSSSWKRTGEHSLLVKSLPARTNICEQPLHNVSSTGITGWTTSTGSFSVAANGSAMRIRVERTSDSGYAMSERYPIKGGVRHRIAFDLVSSSGVKKWSVAARYFRSNGEQIGSTEVITTSSGLANNRKVSDSFVTPERAASMRILIGAIQDSSSDIPVIDVKNIFLGWSAESTDPLDGAMGSDYFWTGAVNNSPSVYHPPADVAVKLDQIAQTAGTYIASAYVRAADPNDLTSRAVRVKVRSLNSSGTVAAEADLEVNEALDDWARVNSGAMVAPSTAANVDMLITIRAVPRDENHAIDSVLLERATVLGDYFSGASTSSSTLGYSWDGTAHASRSEEVAYAPFQSHPDAETPTGDTLISSAKEDNLYSVSIYYTFSTEIGESAPSQPTTVKVQRAWTSWEWEKPNAAGEPAGGPTTKPDLCADQLVAYMPQEVFDAAKAAGATKWNAYFSTWASTQVPPVTAIKFAEVPLSAASVYGEHSFVRLTPEQTNIGLYDPIVPTEKQRTNSTNPSRGSRGLVAADRMVLVGDPNDPATIHWTSGFAGEYYNFSPDLGGGTKRLTSGNLFLTAAVVLWQNPQSVDTLTILNQGDDGRSNTYYMAPAEITTLSEAVSVMGFEETTAMRGTVSPYGCEVFNNALYHPLEFQLQKSTANNYNISNRSVTDVIENQWQALQDKHHIVSSQQDGRLYFLVYNRLGAPLDDGCWGNEVWVLDASAESPTWSRWLVQGISLRSIEIDKKVMMSVVHPSGIYAFDMDRADDEVFNPDTGLLEMVPIRWLLETNTQGANRAHDAWANLQQANATLGNFQGAMRYGIRGRDVNGMPVQVEKVVRAELDPEPVVLAEYDRDDFLLVRKTMKEWFFFAGSVDTTVDDVTTSEFFSGQLSQVQYRYTPVTVNVGYEYGSVETFEYGSSTVLGATTDSGVPKPYVDIGRP